MLQSVSDVHSGLADTEKKRPLACKYNPRFLIFTRFTSATISCKSALWANACNTPDGGRCVSDNTLLRSSAWIGSQTRISTAFTHASQFGWAIFVNSTFWLFRHHSWKGQAHAFIRARFKSFFIYTYALHKRHSHHQSMGVCKCRFLYDPWHYSLLLWHNCLVYKEAGIPSLWIRFLVQSHISHLWHSHCDWCNLPQCKQLVGCLEGQEDKHRWQCESLLHTWL